MHHVLPFVLAPLCLGLLVQRMSEAGILDELPEMRPQPANCEAGLQGRAGAEDQDEVLIWRRRGGGEELVDEARGNRISEATISCQD